MVIGDERSSADKELLGTRPSEAVLHIPWTTAAMRPLVEFFYGIVHDYPVHEAVKAGWADAAAALQPRMYANPATNQGLRISETLASMLRTARHLEASGLRTAERLAAASVVGAGSTTAAALPEPALEDVPLLSSEVDRTPRVQALTSTGNPEVSHRLSDSCVFRLRVLATRAGWRASGNERTA